MTSTAMSDVSDACRAEDMLQGVYTGKRQHLDVSMDDGPVPASLQTAASSSFYTPSSVSSDDLCQRCRGIDFDYIFGIGSEDFYEHIRPICIGSRGFEESVSLPCPGWRIHTSVETPESSSCGLCKLFASVSSHVGEVEDSSGKIHRYIYAFSARNAFVYVSHGEFLNTDTVMLGVLQDQGKVGAPKNCIKNEFLLGTAGYLCPIQSEPASHIGTRIVSRDQFDIAFTRSCFKECTRHHKICNEGKTHHSFSASFKVIDCKSGIVVEAPLDCEYVALSYVWGAPKEDVYLSGPGSDQDSIIDHCPKVITDSIEVTSAMDFEYLWVDRYCISQLDEANKLTQIRQMGLIYSNSQFTIIAATGDNPRYGLPGVNRTLRIQQSQLKIGKHTLLSTLPSPSHTLSKSKWATRGWTFQEGLLSKRRLIFTDHQVFFECNSTHFSESLFIPLDALINKDTGLFRQNIPPGAFAWKIPGSEPDEFMRYVSDFTKRELTFPSDRLNAMAGVFSVFEKKHDPCFSDSGDTS